jgi:DNA-directed RNA polymerase subunit K/omega|uniref:DNA-directed RNA polymerase n=1 Tax=viral metagenome TaxID=1070528 RepID=A0A6C0D9R8_9ZZZZ
MDNEYNNDDLYSSSDEEDEKSIVDSQNDDDDSEKELEINDENDVDIDDINENANNDDDEYDDDGDEENEHVTQIGGVGPNPNLLDEDSDEDEDYQSAYLQKFNAEINKNYILDFHPECAIHNYDEITLLTKVIRDKNNNIIDDLHKTIPFLTKYERTRVIGQRAKQINTGAKAFIKVPENVIDGYLVAELELMQKRIPFIIRRPTPGGGCEYWNLKDLEIISF